MLHESSLGQFDTEERATEAFEKELANAKKLGWGATNGADGKSCPGLLRKAYRDIHTVLLDAKEMDTGTSRLRTLIGNLHNRNRVLERQGDLSPAALRWLAAPLVCSFVLSFVPSFLRSFDYSFVRSFRKEEEAERPRRKAIPQRAPWLVVVLLFHSRHLQRLTD